MVRKLQTNLPVNPQQLKSRTINHKSYNKTLLKIDKELKNII